MEDELRMKEKNMWIRFRDYNTGETIGMILVGIPLYFIAGVTTTLALLLMAYLTTTFIEIQRNIKKTRQSTQR